VKIAVSSWSFRTALKAGELKLFQIPSACAVLGLQLVELNDRFLRTKGRTGRLLSALGVAEQTHRHPDLSPFSLGMIEKGLRAADSELVCFTAENDFVPEEAEQLPEQVRYVKAVIGAARYLHCDMVRLWLTHSPRRAIDVSMPTIKAFQEVASTAAKAEVRLALAHRFGYLEELEVIIYVLEQVRSYYLGACLNLGFLPANDWRAGLSKILPYTIHVHAQSREFDAEGNETSISYPAAIAALKSARYRGYVSIEYVGEGDPLEGIVATRNLVERCIEQKP
jgi:sugar phosphate isomerase/epimerase